MELLSSECKNVLVRVKFIGFCPADHKINVSQKRYVRAGGWSVDNFNRVFASREGKDDSLKFIDDVIVGIHKIFSENRSKETRDAFTKSMKEMNIGLENLKNTYKKEPIVVSSLSVYMDQVGILIRQIDGME